MKVVLLCAGKVYALFFSEETLTSNVYIDRRHFITPEPTGVHGGFLVEERDL